MDERLLKELIKTRTILKRKFRSLKLGEDDSQEILQKTFKPITEPLKEFVKSTTFNNSNSKIEKIDNQNDSFKLNKHLSENNTSTPKKENTEVNFDDSNSEITYQNMSDDFSFNSAINSSEIIDLSFLKNNKILDTTYGPHKDSENVWKFGDSEIEISKDKIIIGNQHWALTSGLIELLFYKEPKNYEPYELDIYKKILINTNAHRRKHSPTEQIKGTKSKKYKKIIKKLFKDETISSPLKLNTKIQKGNGMMMEFSDEKANYKYWNDPNELVDRLRLLIASEGAGHNNHHNEINSIIEELKEANIIV